MSEQSDAAARGLTFREWLKDREAEGDMEYARLYGAFDGLSPFAPFHKMASRLSDEDVPLLTGAIAMHKVDQQAHEKARAALGVALSVDGGLVATKCLLKKRNGDNCSRPVVPGTDRCEKHGGALVDIESRRAVLMSAFVTIVEGSEKAVAALLDVVEHGRSEMARVQAAKELLDRAGLTPDVNINVSVTTVDAGQILRDRLIGVAKRIEPEAEVIEAEVVE